MKVLVVCPPPDESLATLVAPQNENPRTAIMLVPVTTTVNLSYLWTL